MQGRSLTTSEFVEEVHAKLQARPFRPGFSHFKPELPGVEPAAFALIVGSGFSWGAVPLVGELMHETIGDYYFPDQELTSMRRPPEVLRRHSRDFWREFNAAARGSGLSEVAVDRAGLPQDPGEAYQELFAYGVANVLFAEPPPPPPSSYVDRLRAKRGDLPESEPLKANDVGAGFLNGFLRYVIDAGSEHGYGSTGRSDLNDAHIFLAALLEQQQLGNWWKTCAFARTVLTTNFDTLLQNALQSVNVLYCLTDNPERGIDPSELLEDELAIRIVYVHGSILRYNPASSRAELGLLADTNADAFRRYLETRDVIVIGYGGWDDALMTALRSCDPGSHHVYWCDVLPAPGHHAADFLKGRGESATYVQLGEAGADGLMRALYERLTPKDSLRDPVERYAEWRNAAWADVLRLGAVPLEDLPPRA